MLDFAAVSYLTVMVPTAFPASLKVAAQECIELDLHQNGTVLCDCRECQSQSCHPHQQKGTGRHTVWQPGAQRWPRVAFW